MEPGLMKVVQCLNRRDRYFSLHRPKVQLTNRGKRMRGMSVYRQEQGARWRLTLPMEHADRGSHPVYYLLCSDLGQVVNLSLSGHPPLLYSVIICTTRMLCLVCSVCLIKLILIHLKQVFYLKKNFRKGLQGT